MLADCLFLTLLTKQKNNIKLLNKNGWDQLEEIFDLNDEISKKMIDIFGKNIFFQSGI